MRKTTTGAIMCAVLTTTSFLATRAEAAFIPGDIVVLQEGDGTVSQSSSATAVFLKEYDTSGNLISTTAMPTVASGSNMPFTISGSATSEGFLKVSVDGRYLSLAGYGVVPATSSPNTATSSSAPRIVALVDMNQNIDTSINLGNAYNGSNIRGAVTTNGTDIWTSGNASGSGQGVTAGVRYTQYGSGTSTQLNSTTTNDRVVNIVNGQLYASSGSTPVLGVATIGTDEPTTSGRSITELNGMPTSGTHSPYDFWFKDANTLYVADDGSASSGGGIQKWTSDGSNWTLQYTLSCSVGGVGSVGARGLAGEVDSNGDAELFATTSDSSPNRLVEITDLGAGSAATLLATAPKGVGSTAFRGVVIIPAATSVPEPTSLALLGLTGAGLLRRRRSC